MRIGIDIDDTITNTNDLIEQLMIENNLTDMSIDFDSYDNGELNKFEDLIKNNICGVLENCKLKENVKDVIDYLKDRAHEIYFITARTNRYSDKVYDITKEYLKKHNIYYDELLFGYTDKVDICLEKDIDIMLDDNYILIKKLKDTKVDGVLYSTKYNKIYNYEGTVINNWLEFKEFIDNYRK